LSQERRRSQQLGGSAERFPDQPTRGIIFPYKFQWLLLSLNERVAVLLPLFQKTNEEELKKTR
jgi:hypothetical protein